VVCGGLWGDEGKGKVVAYLALADKPAVIARAGVGPNAGHTIYVSGQKYVMRQVPCGFVESSSRLLIGAGVLVDPDVTLDEVERLAIGDRLGIDPQCTVIDPEHREADRERAHLKDVVGTTGTGTGPANEARTARRARIARDEPRLAGFVCDVAAELNGAVRAGHSVIVEGTQGFRLSLYHGDYPFVTSKDTSASAMCADVGLGPTLVDDVLVVFKAFSSRVGNGPMPTEISQELASERGWQEFGSVTGRPRRIGEFDYEQSARAVMVNGATEIAITNLDRRFPAAAGVKEWSALPAEAHSFVDGVESALGVAATILSTGPDVWDTVDRR
jgi:adenylosuccinate synthase